MRRRGALLAAVVSLVSALATGAVIVAIGSRSDLQRARGDVDAAWVALRPALDDRYRALDAAAGVARSRLGADRALFAEIAGAVTGWISSGAAPVDAQVAAASRLEGLVARLAATVDGTPRLRGGGDVRDALDQLEASDPEDGRGAYNRAVAAYEATRGGFPRRLVAGALGFDTRRTLEVPI